MRCLGIESSCDETALALVDDGRLLGAVMASQADIHALFGGVVPELASREHGRLIGPLFDLLCRQTDVDRSSIDVVAFCRGPGLLGSLLVGAAFAKSLALGLGTKLIGVNHLHAHLLASGLEGEVPFPALGLLVSGGHTHTYRIESPTKFILLGRTLDDAAGEAFDKIGKLLGLPYPAGYLMDTLAQQGQIDHALFRPPYIHNDNLNFSFSGLKTAAATVIAARPELRVRAGDVQNPSPGPQADFCASLTHTIAQTLCIKTQRALEGQQGIKSLILAGGVAANSAVRKHMHELAERVSLPLCVPSPALCTDNGSMVAYTGYLLSNAGCYHSLGVSCIPRGTPVPDDFLY